jgi:hypothetical protein
VRASQFKVSMRQHVAAYQVAIAVAPHAPQLATQSRELHTREQFAEWMCQAMETVAAAAAFGQALWQ